MRCIPILFLILMMLFGTQSQAQREAANWYFGGNAGLTFNNGLPVALQNGKLSTIEGCATISDRNGNLLFYSDGITVYNRQHSVMAGDLKGNTSSTQSVLIVPKPTYPGIYYIITVDKPDYKEIPSNPIEGVNYSVVDMSLNSGFGGILPDQKNIHLITYDQSDTRESEFQSSEKIAAIVHGDCESYWVVTQFTNKFYAFKISSSGFDLKPQISQVPSYIPPTDGNPLSNSTAIGQMKFSADGSKLAIAHATTLLEGGPKSGNNKNGKVFLYDFDNLTGKFTNENLVLYNSYPYGVEFSPKGTKLYVTANVYNTEDALQRGEVYQYDMKSQNISGTQVILNKSTHFISGGLQLAMDGKIYKAGHPLNDPDYHFLSVINKPEAPGIACDFQKDKIDVSPGKVYYGLPIFLQSLLTSDFEFEFLCLGEETHFSITGDDPYDSLEWDFGDGSTSTNEEGYHTYATTGTYTVTLTKFINNIQQNPICKQVNIADIPNVVEKYTLEQCDTQDSNPTDGIAEFNLQLAKNPLSLNNPNTQVFFYESYNAATKDILNQNALQDIYTNLFPNQKLYAKVTQFNSICYNMAELILKANKSIYLNASPAKGCDLGNGEAEFNLVNIAETVKDELNLPSNIQLTFHETENNAALGVMPLPSNFISMEKTIYLRGESENACYGIGSLELIISPFPNVLAFNEYNLCASEFPLNLSSGIIIDGTQNFNFEWNTGETSQEIMIYEGGNYSLRITNAEIGCGRTVQFLVNELPTPEILDVKIDGNGETSNISVITSSDQGNLYSLDDINGSYQTSSVFRDVFSGPHTIFVKNDNACEIKQREIVIFGFPQFFTPNDDGYHDSWKPYKIADPEYQIKGIYIFNRYGKLLKQLDPNGNGWDGTFNNRNMPGDDYWFNVIMENGREFKGHFSLKR